MKNILITTAVLGGGFMVAAAISGAPVPGIIGFITALATIGAISWVVADWIKRGQPW